MHRVSAVPLPEESAMKPDLDAFWMPFTANRQFKKAPRLLAKSSGMHYWTTRAARCSTAWPACGA